MLQLYLPKPLMSEYLLDGAYKLASLLSEQIKATQRQRISNVAENLIMTSDGNDLLSEEKGHSHCQL